MNSYNSIKLSPTVYPTKEEFSNFNEFITNLEKQYSENYGMIKV